MTRTGNPAQQPQNAFPEATLDVGEESIEVSEGAPDTGAGAAVSVATLHESLANVAGDESFSTVSTSRQF